MSGRRELPRAARIRAGSVAGPTKEDRHPAVSWRAEETTRAASRSFGSLVVFAVSATVLAGAAIPWFRIEFPARARTRRST